MVLHSMNKKVTLFGVICLMMVFTFSCKEDEFFDPPSLSTAGDGYFMTSIGKFIEYQVDSIRFDVAVGINDTSQFFYKDEVVSQSTDLLGDTTWIINRFRKNNVADNYLVEKAYEIKRTNTTAETFIDNLRFISMIFPVAGNVSWDGNGFIDITSGLEYLQDWSYQYAGINTSRTINGLTFDNTIEIIQTDTENLVELRKSTETYAKELGLIHKELRILDKQDLQASWDFPEVGFIIEMTVIDHN